MKKVKWLSSKVCDICGEECKEYLIDGSTVHRPWATMCPLCAAKHSTASKINKFGVGIGQLYKKDENGDFVKIKG